MKFDESRLCYGLRKLNIGLASVLLGTVVYTVNSQVSADEVDTSNDGNQLTADAQTQQPYAPVTDSKNATGAPVADMLITQLATTSFSSVKNDQATGLTESKIAANQTSNVVKGVDGNYYLNTDVYKDPSIATKWTLDQDHTWENFFNQFPNDYNPNMQQNYRDSNVMSGGWQHAECQLQHLTFKTPDDWINALKENGDTSFGYTDGNNNYYRIDPDSIHFNPDPKFPGAYKALVDAVNYDPFGNLVKVGTISIWFSMGNGVDWSTIMIGTQLNESDHFSSIIPPLPVYQTVAAKYSLNNHVDGVFSTDNWGGLGLESTENLDLVHAGANGSIISTYDDYRHTQQFDGLVSNSSVHYEQDRSTGTWRLMSHNWHMPWQYNLTQIARHGTGDFAPWNVKQEDLTIANGHGESVAVNSENCTQTQELTAYDSQGRAVGTYRFCIGSSGLSNDDSAARPVISFIPNADADFVKKDAMVLPLPLTFSLKGNDQQLIWQPAVVNQIPSKMAYATLNFDVHYDTASSYVIPDGSVRNWNSSLAGKYVGNSKYAMILSRDVSPDATTKSGYRCSTWKFDHFEYISGMKLNFTDLKLNQNLAGTGYDSSFDSYVSLVKNLPGFDSKTSCGLRWTTPRTSDILLTKPLFVGNQSLVDSDIILVPKWQPVNIQYVDYETGKEVSREAVRDENGSGLLAGSSLNVNYHVPAGYYMVPGDYPRVMSRDGDTISWDHSSKRPKSAIWSLNDGTNTPDHTFYADWIKVLVTKNKKIPVKIGDHGVTEHDVKRVVKRTLNMRFPDGKTKSLNQSVTFTRSAIFDVINNKVEFGKWSEAGEHYFDALKPDTLVNYKPSDPGFAATKVTVDSQNEVKNVTYIATAASVNYQFVDDDDDGKVVKSGVLSGTVGGTIKTGLMLPEHYDLAAGSVVPDVYHFNSTRDKDLIVHLKHHHSDISGQYKIYPALATDRVYRVIEDLPDSSQKVIFKMRAKVLRHATRDEVTGEIKYGNYYSSSPNIPAELLDKVLVNASPFDEIQGPHDDCAGMSIDKVAGYNWQLEYDNVGFNQGVKVVAVKAGNTSVNGWKWLHDGIWFDLINGQNEVASVLPSRDFHIKYTPQQQSVSYQFVDDDLNGKIIKVGKITGLTDQRVNTNFAVPENYQLVGEMPAIYQFNGDDNEMIVIHLKHVVDKAVPGQVPAGVDPNQLTHIVIRTISFCYPSGLTKSIEQKAVFTRGADYDRVTKKANYHAWDKGHVELPALNISQIAGYASRVNNRSDNVVSSILVTPETSNQSLVVDYVPLDQKIVVNYRDVNYGSTVMSETFSRKTGELFDPSTVIAKLPPNYELVTNQIFSKIRVAAGTNMVNLLIKPKLNEKDETKIVKRTLVCYQPDGSKKNVVQQLQFKRTNTYRNGRLFSAGKWQPVNGDTFTAYYLPPLGPEIGADHADSLTVTDPGSFKDVVQKLGYHVQTIYPKLSYVDNQGQKFFHVPNGYHVAKGQEDSRGLKLVLKDAAPIEPKTEFVNRVIIVNLPNGKAKTIKSRVMKGESFANTHLPRIKGYRLVIKGGLIAKHLAKHDENVVVDYAKL